MDLSTRSRAPAPRGRLRRGRRDRELAKRRPQLAGGRPADGAGRAGRASGGGGRRRRPPRILGPTGPCDCPCHAPWRIVARPHLVRRGLAPGTAVKGLRGSHGAAARKATPRARSGHGCQGPARQAAKGSAAGPNRSAPRGRRGPAPGRPAMRRGARTAELEGAAGGLRPAGRRCWINAGRGERNCAAASACARQAGDAFFSACRTPLSSRRGLFRRPAPRARAKRAVDHAAAEADTAFGLEPAPAVSGRRAAPDVILCPEPCLDLSAARVHGLGGPPPRSHVPAPAQGPWRLAFPLRGFNAALQGEGGAALPAVRASAAGASAAARTGAAAFTFGGGSFSTWRLGVVRKRAVRLPQGVTVVAPVNGSRRRGQC